MWLVVPTILMGFVNVVLRYTGATIGKTITSNALIEGQWYLYSLTFLLAFPFILKNQINVRVDFWFANRTEKTKAWIDFVGHLIALIPFCIMGIVVSRQPVLFSWQIREVSADPGGLPRYPIKTMILVGFVLLALQAIAEMFKLVRVLRGIEHYDVSKAPVRIE
jgi:TRAP-type mannitol/chloroaromatic compound transport system permease small subunit